MKKHCIFLLSLFILTPILCHSPKILHMSFHMGCIKDIETVAQELNLDVTPWYILSADRPRTHFDGTSTGNAVYNITHERAQHVWELHKDYFDQFDMIITSDTAPLARIFLQNGWKKPLIIWICNRFDYGDWQTAQGKFPDQELYDLFRKATQQPNVKVIGYTLYEHYYAQARGVTTDFLTITPIGSVENSMRYEGDSYIPSQVNKSETIFIYPRLTEQQLSHIEEQCAQLHIKTYCGKYNGPHDLAGFKGILHFPYAQSNLALFENMLLGLVYFIPSETFIREQVQEGKPIRYCMLNNFSLMEWYSAAHRSSIVYFDSWQDLKNKIDFLDYTKMRKQIKHHAQEHRATMLARWQKVFNEMSTYSLLHTS